MNNIYENMNNKYQALLYKGLLNNFSLFNLFKKEEETNLEEEDDHIYDNDIPNISKIKAYVMRCKDIEIQKAIEDYNKGRNGDLYIHTKDPAKNKLEIEAIKRLKSRRPDSIGYDKTRKEYFGYFEPDNNNDYDRPIEKRAFPGYYDTTLFFVFTEEDMKKGKYEVICQG